MLQKSQVCSAVAALVVLVLVFVLLGLLTQSQYTDPCIPVIVEGPTRFGVPLKEQFIDPWGKPIRCFYINLDRSSDRRALFTKRAYDVNLECTRVTGVDGKVVGALNVVARNDFAKSMAPTEVGCVASHLKTIKQAFDLGLDYACIFEDDTTFEFVDFWPPNVITNLLTDIPDYTGIVQLYWSRSRNDYMTYVVPTQVRRGKDSLMSSAYIVTRRGMLDVLKVASNKENFEIVKRYDHQKEGVADKYIYDLTRTCTSGLPLLCVDTSDLVSTNTTHPSYRDVVRAKQIYQSKTIRYKPYVEKKPYRLGDAVRGIWEAQKTKEYHNELYPNSLVSLYFSKTNTYNKFDILAEAVREFQQTHECLIPNANETVLHLRVGDVLEMSPHSVDHHLSENARYFNGESYVKNLAYFNDQFSKFRRGMHVTILCGTHRRDLGMKKTNEYVAKVKAHLESKGFTTCIRTTHGPDEDFVYAVFAENIVTTGGGFSLLIKNVHAILHK
jgi:hypothetical protein